MSFTIECNHCGQRKVLQDGFDGMGNEDIDLHVTLNGKDVFIHCQKCDNDLESD